MMNECIEKGFLDEYSDDFLEYIEKNRFSNWSKKDEYKELLKAIESLKSKCPNVANFLEDGESEVLYETELKVLRNILKLQSEINQIEEKEIFKLGMKENYIYLQNMGVI